MDFTPKNNNFSPQEQGSSNSSKHDHTNDYRIDSSNRSIKSQPGQQTNNLDIHTTAINQKRRESESNSDNSGELQTVQVKFSKKTKVAFTNNNLDPKNYASTPNVPFQANMERRSSCPFDHKLDDKIKNSAIFQASTNRFDITAQNLIDDDPSEMETNRSRTSRNSKSSRRGSMRRKSIIKNMPRKDRDFSPSSAAQNKFKSNNKMLVLANTMAEGVSQVIDHFELIQNMEDELIANWKSYGAWSEKDVGTLVKLIINGAKERAIRLIEAYKVIGLITREIGLDFPNRVTLLKGKCVNTNTANMITKVRFAINNLYNKVGCMSLDDLEHFTELAQN